MPEPAAQQTNFRTGDQWDVHVKQQENHSCFDSWQARPAFQLQPYWSVEKEQQ